MRLRRKIPPPAPDVDLGGRLAVVTGASSGIGLWTAVGLAERGADVVLLGRHPERLEQAVAQVKASAPDVAVTSRRVDFASLAATTALGSELCASLERVDVLVNNAGLWSTKRRESEEGFELTFAVNHLAPYVFTHALCPSLLRSDNPRVVNVSSRLHRKETAFDFEDTQQARRHYSSMRAYQQSKLANVLFTRALARRAGERMGVFAVHPGDVATNVVRDNKVLAWGSDRLGKLWLLTPEEGARTSLHAAVTPALESGSYLAWGRVAEPSSAARDLEQSERLWKLTEHLTGVVYAPSLFQLTP